MFRLGKEVKPSGPDHEALKSLTILTAEFLSCTTVCQRYQMLIDHPELLEPQLERVMYFAVYDSGQVPRKDRKKVWQYVSGMFSECRQHGAGVLLLSYLLYQAWSKGTDSLRHAIEKAANPEGQEFSTSQTFHNEQRIALQEELASHPDLAQFSEARACLLRQNVDIYLALFQTSGAWQWAYRACDAISALGNQQTQKDSFNRCLYFVVAASREHLSTAQTDPLDKAIDECLKILPQYEKNATQFSTLHTQLGNLYLGKSKQTGSVSDLETSITHLMLSIEGNSELSSKAIALCYLGLAETELFKRTQKAEALEAGIKNLRQAVSISVPQSLEQCGAQMNLALALKEKFRKTKQASLMNEALELLESCCNPNNAGYEIDGAVRVDSLGTTLREYSEYLYFSGSIDQATGMLNRCIEMHKQSLALVENGNGPKGYLYSFLGNLGIALKNRDAFISNDADLTAACEYLERALSLISPRAAFRCALLNNLAMGYTSLFLKTSDFALLDRAIRLMQDSVDTVISGSSEHIEYLFRLGTYTHRRFQKSNSISDLDDCLTVLEQALAVAEETLNWSALSYKLGQHNQNKPINALIVDLYLRKAELCPEAASFAKTRALEVNESSKARVLFAMLNYQNLQAPRELPVELIAEEHRYLEALLEVDKEQLQSHGLSVLSKTSLDVNHLNQRHFILDGLTAVWNIMESLGPQGRDYVKARRGYRTAWADIAALSKKLGKETALISLFTEQEDILVFVVRAGQQAPHVVRVPSTISRLNEIFKSFSAEMINWHAPDTDKKQFKHEWQELGIHIFAPIIHLLTGVKHITISPHGRLHSLPLHALSLDQSGRCLIDDFSVSYTPALGPLVTLSNKQPLHTLDSLVIGFTPNPLERETFIGEAESVNKIVQGRIIANKAATASSLKQYSNHPLKVMHFSCHGAFDKHDALHSAILLADGPFTVRSWLALRLRVDLVTLSACQLAQSSSLGGQEMAGFVQAIFISGSRSALLGLWNVNALVTKKLMERFYRIWLNTDLPVTKPEALRQAILELRNGKSQAELIEAGIEASDPYLWAPFCLYGI